MSLVTNINLVIVYSSLHAFKIDFTNPDECMAVTRRGSCENYVDGPTGANAGEGGSQYFGIRKEGERRGLPQ